MTKDAFRGSTLIVFLPVDRVMFLYPNYVQLKAGCFVIAIPTKWTIKQDFTEADFLIYPSDSEKIIDNVERLLQDQ